MASSGALCTGSRGTPIQATSRSACRSHASTTCFAARVHGASECRATHTGTQPESRGPWLQASFHHHHQQALASLHASTFPTSKMQPGTRSHSRRSNGRPGGFRFISCSSSPASSGGSEGDARDTSSGEGAGAGSGAEAEAGSVSGFGGDTPEKNVPSKGTSDGDSVDEDLSGKLGDWREFRAKLVRSGIAETATDPTADSITAEPGLGESSKSDSDPPNSRLAESKVSEPELEAASAVVSSDTEVPSSAPTDQTLATPTGVLEGVVVPEEQERTSSTGAAAASSDPASTVHPSTDTAGATLAGIPGSSAGALWAHPLAAPEQGCLVIAHPAAFGVSQQYFNQAVIFLFTHGPEGSAGVILNRPSQYTLSQVAGLDEFVPEFAASPLYIGGDVGPTAMLCLHGIDELAESSGAQKICNGIYLGGSKGAKEHIQRGASAAMDYRWFARYAGWAPNQLEREVESGYWFLAASSPRVVLKHCIQLEKPLWREVMEMMGGEYEKLSKRTYGEA